MTNQSCVIFFWPTLYVILHEFMPVCCVFLCSFVSDAVCVSSHDSAADVCMQLAAVPPSHSQTEERHIVGRPQLTEQPQSRWWSLFACLRCNTISVCLKLPISANDCIQIHMGWWRWYGDRVCNTTGRTLASCLLFKYASCHRQGHAAVKLCCNKILQFLTGGAS